MVTAMATLPELRVPAPAVTLKLEDLDDLVVDPLPAKPVKA